MAQAKSNTLQANINYSNFWKNTAKFFVTKNNVF